MDLTTDYMGLSLSSPLVPSASPLSQILSNIRQMEDSGAGAVVLWSLFEEQIAHDAEQLEHYLHYGADRWAESLTYFPSEKEYHLGPDAYLDHIARAKAAVDIPIIASLNGISDKGWVSYAKQIEQAGADALELNIYYIPTDPQLQARDVEDVYVSIIKAVKSHISIPLAVKVSPYFSAIANMMYKMDQAGADGLVMFNRFYQSDIDINDFEVVPNLMLSTQFESRLPMRWAAILYGKVSASLAVTSGIHTSKDVVKMILAGADVTMMCSALLNNGIDYLIEVRKGLISYLEAKEYESLNQMRGVMSQAHCPEPAAFERANYMKTLGSFGPTTTLE